TGTGNRMDSQQREPRPAARARERKVRKLIDRCKAGQSLLGTPGTVTRPDTRADNCVAVLGFGPADFSVAQRNDIASELRTVLVISMARRCAVTPKARYGGVVKVRST